MNMDPLSAFNADEKIQMVTLTILTIFCIALEIILHFYLGISSGYTHFFYIPLVLAAIWYQREAVILALCLADIHISIGFFLLGESLWAPLLRSAMFVIITLLVGTLSEELKRTEESLRQSHQILQTILDTIPVRVFWKDRDLKYLGSNRPFAQDAGFNEPKELIGKDDCGIGWRGQAEIYCADDLSVIASGKAKVMIEEPQKTRDGKIIWLLTSKVPLRDATGGISGVLGTYTDITEFHNSKEAIRESEEKYRAFFATSKDSVFITSKDGRFVDFNNEAPAFFGYRDREEFETVNMRDLYCNASERQEHVRVIEQSGFVKDYTVDLRKKDGSIIHALVTSVARKDIAGNVIGFQGTIKDITEQRRAEEALKESNERYISYIKEAAMRLKTPVEVVEQNIITLLEDIKTGDADGEQVLLDLQIQVKNMEQIRQNILDLNKTIVDGYGEMSPASKQFLTE
jgi:PAS domain S-box-containing protein